MIATIRPGQILTLALAVASAAACDLAPEPDPSLAGPDAGAVAGEEVDEGGLEDAVTLARPRYQMPFRCGQRWRGNTFTTHNPLPSVDFNRDGDFGDAVVASAGGTVTVVGDTGSDSYGKWIEIGHGGGHRTRYAHLSRRTVSVGQQVRKGQKIGEVGESGGASGPHLHYEQRIDGVPVRIRLDGDEIFYYGERVYLSRNCN